jgi:hypothetical protein
MAAHPSIPSLLARQRELDAMASALAKDRAVLAEAGGASSVEVACLKRAERDCVDAANCCKSLVSALQRRATEESPLQAG